MATVLSAVKFKFFPSLMMNEYKYVKVQMLGDGQGQKGGPCIAREEKCLLHSLLWFCMEIHASKMCPHMTWNLLSCLCFDTFV